MSIKDDDPVEIDYKTYKRMVAAVRWVESQTSSVGVSRGGSPPYNALLRAKSASMIPGGTFADPGEGSAVVYHYNQADDVWESGITVDVLNQFEGDAIASNTALVLALISCKYVIVAAGCEAEGG